MRRLLILVLAPMIASCASTKVAEQPVCFASQDEARLVGNQIFQNGFANRVNYWLSGDPDNGVTGLGLMWAGFPPEDFCREGQYPVVITYDNDKGQYDEEAVMRWSNFVFRQMLSELDVG